MSKTKILIIFGTRPEAIKLAPLIKALYQETPLFNLDICSTGQHKDLILPILNFFQIKLNYDCHVMEPNQSLLGLSGKILKELEQVLKLSQPNLIIVQGDTTSAYLGALAGFYAKIPVGHVEAGLRTGDKNNPFPEEVNRKMISQLADLHFAPTEEAQQNLLHEGIPLASICVTGNTVIDALKLCLRQLEKETPKSVKKLNSTLPAQWQSKKTILVTLHRRENQGASMEHLMKMLVKIADWENIHLIFILHPNPAVSEPAKLLLSSQNISLIPPQPYEAFIWLMRQCDLILTDSGGIQEEAHYLSKPMIVLRKTTERKEGLSSKIIELGGTQPEIILQKIKSLLNQETDFPISNSQVYGDGTASIRIVAFIKAYLVKI